MIFSSFKSKKCQLRKRRNQNNKSEKRKKRQKYEYEIDDGDEIDEYNNEKYRNWFEKKFICKTSFIFKA